MKNQNYSARSSQFNEQLYAQQPRMNSMLFSNINPYFHQQKSKMHDRMNSPSISSNNRQQFLSEYFMQSPGKRDAFSKSPQQRDLLKWKLLNRNLQQYRGIQQRAKQMLSPKKKAIDLKDGTIHQQLCHNSRDPIQQKILLKKVSLNTQPNQVKQFLTSCPIFSSEHQPRKWVTKRKVQSMRESKERATTSMSSMDSLVYSKQLYDNNNEDIVNQSHQNEFYDKSQSQPQPFTLSSSSWNRNSNRNRNQQIHNHHHSQYQRSNNNNNLFNVNDFTGQSNLFRRFNSPSSKRDIQKELANNVNQSNQLPKSKTSNHQPLQQQNKITYVQQTPKMQTKQIQTQVQQTQNIFKNMDQNYSDNNQNHNKQLKTTIQLKKSIHIQTQKQLQQQQGQKQTTIQQKQQQLSKKDNKINNFVSSQCHQQLTTSHKVKPIINQNSFKNNNCKQQLQQDLLKQSLKQKQINDKLTKQLQIFKQQSIRHQSNLEQQRKISSQLEYIITELNKIIQNCKKENSLLETRLESMNQEMGRKDQIIAMKIEQINLKESQLNTMNASLTFLQKQLQKYEQMSNHTCLITQSIPFLSSEICDKNDNNKQDKKQQPNNIDSFQENFSTSSTLGSQPGCFNFITATSDNVCSDQSPTSPSIFGNYWQIEAEKIRLMERLKYFEIENDMLKRKCDEKKRDDDEVMQLKDKVHKLSEQNKIMKVLKQKEKKKKEQEKSGAKNTQKQKQIQQKKEKQREKEKRERQAEIQALANKIAAKKIQQLKREKQAEELKRKQQQQRLRKQATQKIKFSKVVIPTSSKQTHLSPSSRKSGFQRRFIRHKTANKDSSNQSFEEESFSNKSQSNKTTKKVPQQDQEVNFDLSPEK